MDQTEARRTSERKDSVNGNEEMELEDLSVTNSSQKNLKRWEAEKETKEAAQGSQIVV